MDNDKPNIAMAGASKISLEKMAMMQIIMSLENLNDPVAMQSISDAALQRKKEIEKNT